MTEIAPIPTPLVHDILCIGCGYNLRGLEPSGRCPECGLSVADSNRGDFLFFSDPQWLRKVRFGATLKLWNLLIAGLVGGGAGLISGIGGSVGWAFFLGAVAGLFGLWATLAITTQEPKTSCTEDPVTLRKFIRICAVAAFLGTLIDQLEGSPVIPGSTFFWVLLGLIVILAGLVVQIGELKYFRRFALRAPDPQLARSTRILMWGLGITYALSGVGGAVLAVVFMAIGGPAMPNTTTTPSGVTTTAGATTTVATPAGSTVFGGFHQTVFIAGACVLGLAYFIFGLWYIVLLFRYRKMIHNATMIALGNVPGAIAETKPPHRTFRLTRRA